MELCLIIEPPQLMVWIPFWKNTFGRGIVLCIVSVFSLNGSFLVGCLSLVLSLLFVLSPIVTGSFEVADSILNYAAIFDTFDPAPPFHRNETPDHQSKKSNLGGPYQSIPAEE